jgi:hypothetical protein
MSTPEELADVRSLNGLAETWRTAANGSRRFVPGFDPRSGGRSSRVLDGVMRHLTLDEHPRLIPVIAIPHPFPANGRHRSE